MSIIEKARESAREAEAAAVAASRTRVQEAHAAGEAALRNALRERRFGSDQDAPYSGEVVTLGPLRYVVDGVPFVYERDRRGMHYEVNVALRCPMCGEKTLNTFHGLRDLGKRLAEVEAGKPPFLHDCRQGDIADVAKHVERVARKHGFTVEAVLADVENILI